MRILGTSALSDQLNHRSMVESSKSEIIEGMLHILPITTDQPEYTPFGDQAPQAMCHD